MDFAALLGAIHWVPVIGMTVLSFAMGMAWHQPFLFGKPWAQENKLTTGSARKVNAPLTFGGTAILHFMALSALSAVVSGHGALFGVLTGLAVSLVWVLPAMGGTYLFASRSLRLLAIDAGFYIVLYTAAGLVLGAF
jgi:hypothetical protein